jgi:hypothetical protein
VGGFAVCACCLQVENSFKKAKPVVSKHNIGTEEETKEV